MERPSWHEYFMKIAVEVAARATCDRKHVGAVLVRDRRILATGYNGSVRGLPHCDDVGHDLDGTHCVRTVHAEVNAVCQAARNGTALEGADAYVTTFPCWNCFRMLANAGIAKVFYGSVYRPSPRVLVAARQAGIPLCGTFADPAYAVLHTTADGSVLLEEFGVDFDKAREAARTRNRVDGLREVRIVDLRNV